MQHLGAKVGLAVPGLLVLTATNLAVTSLGP